MQEDIIFRGDASALYTFLFPSADCTATCLKNKKVIDSIGWRKSECGSEWVGAQVGLV